MKRVVCLIDGFNLYHAIHNMHPPHCKWCNYKTLISHFLDADDILSRVLYFTAYAKWDAGKVARHTAFTRALQHAGIQVVLGQFKKKNPVCQKCFRRYTMRVEKESDVNLAVALTSMAYEDVFDKAILVSGDSDFVSTITFLREKFPRKRFGVVIPGDPRTANDLRSAAHFNKSIERGHLLSSLLPQTIELEDGKIISCPAEYLPPPPEATPTARSIP